MGGFSKYTAATKIHLARSVENKKSARLFSFGFSMLNIFPYMMLLIFGLAAGIKFGFFTVNRALLALLLVLIAIYFALPRMAQKIETGIADLKGRKSLKDSNLQT